MHSAYPVFISEEEGTFIVRSRDLPELLTFGDDEASALANAEDALHVVLLSYAEKNLDIPQPSQPTADERIVFVAANVATKLAVIEAFRHSNISKSEFARRMGVAEGEARRILDPDYGSKLDKLELAARALGRRLVVVLEEAA